MSNATHLHLVREPAAAVIAPNPARVALDRERRLVTEAILLVSSGRSRRVTVAGLRHAEQVAEASRPLAATVGVRLVPLATDGGWGTDVAVEAPDVVEPGPARIARPARFIRRPATATAP